MAKLNRRKYQELVRFLKDTIKDERVGHRVRLAAAARLDGIFERHEQAEQNALARKDRAEARADEAQALALKSGVFDTPVAIEASDEEDPQEKMRGVFDSIMRKDTTSADTD